MTLVQVCSILYIEKKICDEEWSKVSPERKKRIRDNILRRAMKREDANARTGDAQVDVLHATAQGGS